METIVFSSTSGQIVHCFTDQREYKMSSEKASNLFQISIKKKKNNSFIVIIILFHI